jgi:hypothetical protein
MAFEWDRMYKWEDNYERQVTDDVVEKVCETYGVEEISDLTEDQIREVEAFYEDMNEYSIMCIGFSNVINMWQSEN